MLRKAKRTDLKAPQRGVTLSLYCHQAVSALGHGVSLEGLTGGGLSRGGDACTWVTLHMVIGPILPQAQLRTSCWWGHGVGKRWEGDQPA